jgi:hypothetical protein
VTSIALADQQVPLIGDRRFWAGSLPVGADRGEQDAAINAAFDEHLSTYVRGRGPIGIALILDPDAVAARPPDVFWPDTKLLYAGYGLSGHQVRIRYFPLALCIDPGPDGPFDYDRRERDSVFALGGDYEVRDFDGSGVGEADIIDLWERHGVLLPDERERRLQEVRTVATTPTGELAGIGTAVRFEHEQTRLLLWGTRVFVSSSHRGAHLMHHIDNLTLDGVTAEPGGAAGLLRVIENEGLRRSRARAVMPTRPFTFIGARPGGATEFVSYFPGVKAPPP